MDPPQPSEVMRREPEDLPPAARTVDLRMIAKPADIDAFHDALKAYGISEKTINKLKTLDGIGDTFAKQLVIPLQKTHLNYVGQLMMLSEVTSELRDQLRGVEGPDGKLVPHSPKALAALHKAYTEGVREQGRGYELMLQGMQVMVAISKGTVETAGQPTKKPGFGQAKKVNG